MTGPLGLLAQAIDPSIHSFERQVTRVLDDAVFTYASVWASCREAVAAVDEARGGLFDGALKANEAVDGLWRAQIDGSLKMAADMAAMRSPLDLLTIHADMMRLSAQAGALGSKAFSDWTFGLNRSLSEPFQHHSMDVRGEA
ncbi:MAG: hypothetical protein HXY25_11260 [Alphaproteobacteria bacterium]|nr:hypothetical protein [Alphaproteobacteria bacterium]